MDRYQVSKQLGDGTYGSVLLAMANHTGEKVAIKKMKKKYYRWEECLSLREVKSLRKLKHANIIQLKEVIRENDQLFFVFEFMKENLYQMMKGRDKLFPESTVRNITYQVLQGLAYMHKHGFFHRDLKPENLLYSGGLLKIADFGLARETRSLPPFTEYVSTRWYRAPEVLLRSTNYSSPIDLWAVGAIMAELYTLRPLFPGSSEIDEIFKICSILGTPSRADWNEGHQLAAGMNFKWPQCVATNLKSIIPNASNDGIQFLKDSMAWDPKKRPTAGQSLKYPIFQVGQGLIPSHSQPQRPQQQAQSMTQRQPLQPQRAAVDPVQASPVSHKASEPPQRAVHKEQENKNPLLPTIQSKQTGANKQNKESYGASKKSGRKRWGASESWDDWDDFDANQSMSKPKRNPAAVKKREEDDMFGGLNKAKRHSITKKDDEDMWGYSKPKRPSIAKTIDDDDEWGFGSDKKSQTKNQPGHINSGRSSGNSSSAKQHYMNKSRYLPGINARNSGTKDSSPSTWGSGMNKTTGIGGISYGRNNNPVGNYGSNANPGYVPSFLSNTNTNKTNYNPGSWKRAQPAPIGLNKNSANVSKPIGASNQVAGRTDWASKYLKS